MKWHGSRNKSSSLSPKIVHKKYNILFIKKNDKLYFSKSLCGRIPTNYEENFSQCLSYRSKL